MKKYTLADLGKWYEFWCPVLGLGEWEIDICIERADRMEEEDAQALCAWSYTARMARITMIDYQDLETRMFVGDPETVFVHELLHIKFAILGDDTTREQHQLLNDMARALVKARRGK